MVKYGLFIILLLTLTACGSVQYVVSRDIPQSPSFTVIPLYQKHRDIEYAATLEKVMIDLGISVVNAPKKGVKNTIISNNQLIQTTATYIAITDSRNSIIKIIKRDTNEVIAVLDNIRDPKFKNRTIRNAFKALGFNIRDSK